jgi:hypothetical protein
MRINIPKNNQPSIRVTAKRNNVIRIRTKAKILRGTFSVCQKTCPKMREARKRTMARFSERVKETNQRGRKLTQKRMLPSQEKSLPVRLLRNTNNKHPARVKRISAPSEKPVMPNRVTKPASQVI